MLISASSLLHQALSLPPLPRSQSLYPTHSSCTSSSFSSTLLYTVFIQKAATQSASRHFATYPSSRPDPFPPSTPLHSYHDHLPPLGRSRQLADLVVVVADQPGDALADPWLLDARRRASAGRLRCGRSPATAAPTATAAEADRCQERRRRLQRRACQDGQEPQACQHGREASVRFHSFYASREQVVKAATTVNDDDVRARGLAAEDKPPASGQRGERAGWERQRRRSRTPPKRLVLPFLSSPFSLVSLSLLPCFVADLHVYYLACSSAAPTTPSRGSAGRLSMVASS